jgi:hypothetical protein
MSSLFIYFVPILCIGIYCRIPALVGFCGLLQGLFLQNVFCFSCPYSYFLISPINRNQDNSTAKTIFEGPWTASDREGTLLVLVDLIVAAVCIIILGHQL